jgi:hypothetical protein
MRRDSFNSSGLPSATTRPVSSTRHRDAMPNTICTFCSTTTIVRASLSLPRGFSARSWSRACGRRRCARATQDEDERADAALYVDEMHNYLALPRSFEDLLAEARGYRLSLVLAHQHMNQLPRDMREALAANARTKVVFACSPEDAAVLERHFEPHLSAHDLHSLGAFQGGCRPCLDAGHGAAFTFRTEPLRPPEDPGRPAAVRQQSAARFGRPAPTWRRTYATARSRQPRACCRHPRRRGRLPASPGAVPWADRGAGPGAA